MRDKTTQQIADQDIGFAVLVQGVVNNEPFWAYASINPDQYEDFLQMQQSGKPYRLTDYGEILEYKVGEAEPSAEAKAAMEEKYGVDHNFDEKVKTLAEAVFGDVKRPASGGSTIRPQP